MAVCEDLSCCWVFDGKSARWLATYQVASEGSLTDCSAEPMASLPLAHILYVSVVPALIFDQMCAMEGMRKEKRWRRGGGRLGGAMIA